MTWDTKKYTVHLKMVNTNEKIDWRSANTLVLSFRSSSARAQRGENTRITERLLRPLEKH